MRARFLAAVVMTIASVVATGTSALGAELSTTFTMVPSNPGSCLADAHGKVTVSTVGVVDNMHVEVFGLPANTDFDLFVIQIPHSTFGLSWYQGDIETDGKGKGVGDFTGRFSQETFIVAPGSNPAPQVHASDATTNPQTAPVHTYHLGLWFNSPTDAQNAGCSNAVTPFNGTHDAGVQVLNTSNFDDDRGPLRRFNP
jgi:hypothetical protein